MNSSVRMGKDPILGLLVRFSVPAIIGLVANALYNIVDRIFIGHVVGPVGIAATTVAFPFMIATFALGMLNGEGGATLISIYLGEGRRERAVLVMGNALLLLAFFALLCVLGGSFFLDDMLRLCGASGTVLPQARAYLGIILWGVPFLLFESGLTYFIRAEGHPRFAMGTLVVGAITNILLDAVFILGLNMGIRGAAFATTISQFVAALWVLFFYVSGRSSVRFRMAMFRPHFEILRRILAIGFPPFLMQINFTVLMILFNRILRGCGGDMAISAMGVFFSLDSLMFLPVVGIGEGAQPLIGYNYGAGNYERVTGVVKLAICAAVAVFTLSFLAGEFLPVQMARLFNTSSSELVRQAARSLRIGYAGLPAAGICVIATSTFQALGKARQSMILSLSRQLVFLLPPLLVLPHFFGVDGVWAAFPISDIGGGVLGGLMLRWEMRRWKGGTMGSTDETSLAKSRMSKDDGEMSP